MPVARTWVLTFTVVLVGCSGTARVSFPYLVDAGDAAVGADDTSDSAATVDITFNCAEPDGAPAKCFD